MKLLIVAYYYPPLPSGGSLRPWLFRDQLVKRGHEVAVVTHTYDATALSTPEFRVVDTGFVRAHGFGASMRWLAWRVMVELANRAGKAYSVFDCWRRGVLRHEPEIHRRFAPDVLLATYPPVETLEIGLELSRRWRVPLVADFRDGLMFEPIEHRRMDRFPCVRDRYNWIEESVLKRARAIVAAHPKLADYFRGRGAVGTVSCVTNSFDPKEIEAAGRAELEGRFINVVHAGSFAASNVSRDIGPFVDAVIGLSRGPSPIQDRLRIHQVGSLTRRERRLVRPLIDLGILIDHGTVSRSQCLAIENAADVLLLMSSGTRASATPGKVFEYLGVGKPILALAEGTYAAEIVREARAGWVLSANDQSAITTRLANILREPRLDHCIAPASDVIERFAVTNRISELESLLVKVVEDPRPELRSE